MLSQFPNRMVLFCWTCIDLFFFLTILILLLEQSNWGIEEVKTRYFCICEVGTGNIWTCSSYSYEGKITCQNITYFIDHWVLVFIHTTTFSNNVAGSFNFLLRKMKFEENFDCNRWQYTWSAGLGICFHH